MAKKNSRKKKSGKSAVKPAAFSTRGLILFGAALVISAAAVYAVREILGPGAFARYIIALVSGLATGISGNPLILRLVERIVIAVPQLKQFAPDLPTQFLASRFPADMVILAAAGVAGMATLRDGIKTGALRYEPMLLIPATAVPGMLPAVWARSASALFRDLFAGAINSPYVVGFVVIVTLGLGVARWAMRWSSPPRHWLWSIIIGPMIGFWIGYLDSFWSQALIALMYFGWMIVLNEEVTGVIAGLPLALLPIWAVKTLYLQPAARAAEGAPMAAPEIAAIVAVAAGFAAAHLFAFRIMSSMKPCGKRALFHIAFAAFFIMILIKM